MAAVVPAFSLRHRSTLARWDLAFVLLASVHGAMLFTWPSIPLITLGLWWSTNTIAHNFIHRPFFRDRRANALFSSFLSLLFGFPQTLWRDRHLAHHSGSRFQIRLTLTLAIESALVILLWVTLIVNVPVFVFSVYLPGWLIGLGLCQLQGFYEHARGTQSHYSRVYNALFFNDGYHREHHERPGVHWRELPHYSSRELPGSGWPAVLRWIEDVNLCSLERLVLRSRLLQSFVIAKHERAMRTLLRSVETPSSVGIVGGGLFPRTALILERLLPETSVFLIDLSWENLDLALGFLRSKVVCVNERFEAGNASHLDLLIIPLAFVGDREQIYAKPPASCVIVHDWIWRRRGQGVVVSWLLLKRLNLVKR